MFFFLFVNGEELFKGKGAVTSRSAVCANESCGCEEVPYLRLPLCLGYFSTEDSVGLEIVHLRGSVLKHELMNYSYHH